MYNFGKPKQTTLRVNKSYEGRTIEAVMRKIWKSGEPITAEGGDLVFYPENIGVPMEVNVRTDRFDEALKIQEQAKREATAKTTGGAKGEQSSDTGEGEGE